MKKVLKFTLAIIAAVILVSCDTKLSDMFGIMDRGNIICVDMYAGGDDSGASWSDACNTIERAILIAKDGDEIWLRDSTYDIITTITITKNIKIIGGFEGDEESKSNRNNCRISKISANMNSEIILLQGNIELDSLSFKNSSNNGQCVKINAGANVAINNSYFGNMVSDASGAGIYIEDSTLAVQNTDFYEISGLSSGKGLYGSNSSVIMYNCNFEQNSTGSRGGAVHLIDCTAFIDGSSFTFNTSGSGTFGGGGLSLENSDVMISNSRFENNSANVSGAAIHTTNLGNLKIQDCIFEKNHASFYGGSFFSDTTEILIENSILKLNTCDRDGGAVYIQNAALAVFFRCSFYDNTALISGDSVYLKNVLNYNNIISDNYIDSDDFEIE